MIQVINDKHRRISFYAGPSSGKSTTAAYIFSQLKSMLPTGKQVELVQEYAKLLAWKNYSIQPWDQLKISSIQLERELSLLSHGVDFIVTDSPLLLQYHYANKYNSPIKDELLSIILKFEKEYPSLNIFLDRKDKPYDTKGRYETYEQALNVDSGIKELLGRFFLYEVFDFQDKDSILKYILSKIS